jgi:hypothetical protein
VGLNNLIDLDNAVIVDVEASRAIRQAEVGAARTMIERAQDVFGLYPERLAADTAYGSADMLGWLVHERGIEPHIPVFDKSERRDGTFERADFTYDHKRDLYTCPGGKELRSRQIAYKNERPLVDEDGMVRYRASKLDCDACALNLDAVRTLRRVRYHAPSMRALAIWRAILPKPMPILRRGIRGEEIMLPMQAHRDAGEPILLLLWPCGGSAV